MSTLTFPWTKDAEIQAPGPILAGRVNMTHGLCCHVFADCFFDSFGLNELSGGYTEYTVCVWGEGAEKKGWAYSTIVAFEEGVCVWGGG